MSSAKIAIIGSQRQSGDGAGKMESPTRTGECHPRPGAACVRPRPRPFAPTSPCPPSSVRAIAKRCRPVLRIANEYRIPVYPVSGGCNWGYGSRVPERERLRSAGPGANEPDPRLQRRPGLHHGGTRRDPAAGVCVPARAKVGALDGRHRRQSAGQPGGQHGGARLRAHALRRPFFARVRHGSGAAGRRGDGDRLLAIRRLRAPVRCTAGVWGRTSTGCLLKATWAW